MGYNIWRIQTNTDSFDGRKIADICLNEGIVAMGWSFRDNHLDKKYLSDEEILTIQNERSKIRTFDDYVRIYTSYKIYPKKSRVPDTINDNIKRLKSEMGVGDLIWMRNRGLYYLGRVGDGSIWQYNSAPDILDMDASNQRTNISWFLVGDENAVPGAIATAMIRGRTLQRISKTGVDAFSMLLYNKLSGIVYYENICLECNLNTFYSLLSSDDCEDLLCSWLYDQYGYIAIPSTNKKSTELYECVLKNPQNGTRIYPQVKNEQAGESDIDVIDYLDLNGEVWLFSTFATIQNLDKMNDKIHLADATILFEYVISGKGNNYLPDSILRWYDLIIHNET